MLFISLLAGLALGIFAIIFALQNFVTITVVFFAWQFQGTLALILLLCVAAGVAICILFTLPQTIRDSFELSGLKKQNRKLEEDLGTARKALLEAEHKLGASKIPATETTVILPDGSSVKKIVS